MKQIELTQGKFAVIDDDDYERVVSSGLKWHAHKDWNTYYARASVIENGKKRFVLMHRLVLGLEATGYPLVDHIDHNGLNNTRANMRTATISQNATNRTFGKLKYHYRGVIRKNEGWIARIKKNGKRKILGPYKTEEDAARAYDRAAKELHGEFAVLNFP